MLVKKFKNGTLSIISINCSSNNTILNISNFRKKTIFCTSCGSLGLKGSRRSTSYASQTIANLFGKKLYFLGIKYAFIRLKGFGNGRYSCIKGLFLSGIKILRILDVTFLPFNGCKLSKKRRV